MYAMGLVAIPSASASTAHTCRGFRCGFGYCRGLGCRPESPTDFQGCANVSGFSKKGVDYVCCIVHEESQGVER